MWATCNVGANKPEDSGLLFQFGRVDGYVYNDSNNQFRTKEQNKQDTGNSYIPLTTSGRTYNAGETLDLEDDAAHVNMGGKWKMPTKDELQELLDNTSHEVTTINEVEGMIFTSKVSEYKDKRLFIPFAGAWYGDFGGGGGGGACVWSSQVHDSGDYAWRLLCVSPYENISTEYRCNAISVRGVFNK